MTFTSGNWGLDKTKTSVLQSDGVAGAPSPAITNINGNGDLSLGAFTRNVDQDYFCDFSAYECAQCPRITHSGTFTTFILDLGSSMPVNSIYWAELESTAASGTHWGGAVEVRVGSYSAASSCSSNTRCVDDNDTDVSMSTSGWYKCNQVG